MKTVTPHSSPIMGNNLSCEIPLSEDEVDYSNIETLATEKGFRKQTDRHITILGGLPEVIIREDTIKEVKDLLESLEWKYEQKEIYLIRKQGSFDDPDIIEDRQSYIRMVDMPDIDVFYKKINSILKTDIPTQVPHIHCLRKEKEKIRDGMEYPSHQWKSLISLTQRK
jgi:hypothetical protein